MADRAAFLIVLLLQVICAAFFLWDVFSAMLGIQVDPIAWALYELLEIGAVVGLILGISATATLMSRSQRAQARAEASLRIASGAFLDVLEENFEQWGLTPAERDVALFSIKGLSTAEIAALRQTSEGTVKAQTNAIYRKAGVTGRPQLLSHFIDTLISDTGPRPATLSV